MIIRFAKKEELKAIADLSAAFAKEGCCNGIVADDEKYFEDKQVAIALDKDIVIGYAYGEIEAAKKNKSYVKKGDKVFYLEEMYVVPSKRNKNVGEKLFKFLEKEARQKGAQVLELNAVSKDYKKLLKFYIEQMNMKFFSAYLYKELT